MGSVCLLAAWSWTRIEAAANPPSAAVRHAFFAAAAAASLLILLPVRAWQAHSLEHSYALAERQIQALEADVVIVGDTGLAFGTDLVRNDPFLQRRPIVLEAGAMSQDQLRELCGRYDVGWFLPAGAADAGIPVRIMRGPSVLAACAASFTRSAPANLPQSTNPAAERPVAGR
jgi:hypothetical protein